ncbi:MAG: hypothetical protein DRP56_00905 [Planctomycetota bacterium]|nr:MAG: hypothetical protein DRP56_00905 [Planctomycetota bacterium]RLB91225.1 MAG: hypothetical protein DRH10_02365 [Deltaproteobacteria bacterium]
MSVYKNFIGTMKGLFHIGGPSGNTLKNATDGIDVRNAADDAFQNLKVKQASGAVDEHAVNWLDLRDANVLVQFSFDGGSAPSAGTNTGTYGFCHTSGGSYTAGQVYYDDGTTLRATKIHVGTRITTGSAITGTVSLNANGVYAAHSATAPFSWTLKGDGMAGGTGIVKTIEIPIDTSASKSSTSSIPDGAEVLRVSTKVTTAYDNNATIEVLVDGSSDLTIQPTDENDPSEENMYVSDVEDGVITSSNEGVVTVNVANTPSAGAGAVLVEFAPTTLA